MCGDLWTIGHNVGSAGDRWLGIAYGNNTSTVPVLTASPSGVVDILGSLTVAGAAVATQAAMAATYAPLAAPSFTGIPTGQFRPIFAVNVTSAGNLGGNFGQISTSSITKTATGTYVIVFATAHPLGNFGVIGMPLITTITAAFRIVSGSATNSTTITIYQKDASNAAFDGPFLVHSVP